MKKSKLDPSQKSATRWTARGAVAGGVSALALTLWVLATSSGAGEARGAGGAGYVAAAFGLLGPLAVGAGAALGAWLDAALWTAARRRSAWDRQGAASAFAPIILAALASGLAVALAYLAVLSGFQRARFAGLGAGLVGAAVTIACAPLVARLGARLSNAEADPDAAPSPAIALLWAAALAALTLPFALLYPTALARAGFESGEKGGLWWAVAPTAGLIGATATYASTALLLTKPVEWIARWLGARGASVLALLGWLALVGLGALATSRLGVFSGEAIAMGAALAALVPLLLVALGRARAPRRVWISAASALALAALVCLGAAWSSAGLGPAERALLADRNVGGLVPLLASAAQRAGDADGDGWPGAFGGADCDDSDASIYPGATDVPRNGVDEDCSGSDAEPPSMDRHPSRRLMRRAVAAAERAQRAKAADLPAPPKNIVLVLVDTLRADHMGFMGYERPTTPNLDALAASSVVFEDVYAPAPHTPRSIPPLFFSRYPSHMEWRGGQYNYPKVRPENLGMFEVLADNGWTNRAYSSHFYFQEKRGMGQGFASWDNDGFGTIAESNDDIAAPRIWSKARPGLAALSKERPFSMFLHLFEPHARWIGHKEFDFGGGDTTIERHKANYDSEIAYVDQYVGKLVDALKERGLWDEAILVVTSDHGEAFGEHKVLFHGQNLYDEVLRVPLLVRVPGWPARRVSGPVSLVDVAPTLLDLVGLSIPAPFEGSSLVGAMRGDEPVPDRPIYAELLPYTSWKEHHKAIVWGEEKLIRVLSAGTNSYFNLAEDPNEQKDLARERPERAEKLRDELDAWIASGAQ